MILFVILHANFVSSFKNKVQATKSGPNTYFLVTNGSFKEIEVHRHSDGGALKNK
jgi:hypothetical protein